MTTKRKIVVALLLLFTVSAAGSTALLAYQAKKMVHLMDLNNSGTLEFYEVGPLIREKFAQFDKDGDAKLSQITTNRHTRPIPSSNAWTCCKISAGRTVATQP